LDEIVNNLFLELEKTESSSLLQNQSHLTQLNVNLSTQTQNTTNNQHPNVSTNNSDNPPLHSNQRSKEIGATGDSHESSALGVELISYDPMIWGDRTLAEDTVPNPFI
jgi:hypothetical protein